MYKIIFAILLMILPLGALQAHTPQTEVVKTEISSGTLILSDVLKAIPEISNFAPSEFVAKIAGDVKVINGHKYEVRIFFFEDINYKLDLNFHDFCKKHNLLNSKSRIMDQGYGPIEFFSSMSNHDLNERGIHYLLSLRKIE